LLGSCVREVSGCLVTNDICTFGMRIGGRRKEMDCEDVFLFATGRLSEVLGMGAGFQGLTRQ